MQRTACCNPLVARKDQGGKYAVVAGRRRLRPDNPGGQPAQIGTDQADPLPVIDDEADATEVSLAEEMCSARRCIPPTSSTPSRR